MDRSRSVNGVGKIGESRCRVVTGGLRPEKWEGSESLHPQRVFPVDGTLRGSDGSLLSGPTPSS